MGTLTRDFEDVVLNWINSTYDLEMALFTTPTSDDVNDGTEADGTGYARQVITFDSPVAGIMYNDVAITFSGLDNIPHTHAAIFSDVGDMLWQGPLAVTVTPPDMGSISFAVGEISISLS